MRLKQLLVNISNPKNWFYYVQGKYKMLILRLYKKYFNDNKVEKIMYAVYKCPQCYENNSCEDCGCDFMALFSSDKKCKRHVEN